LNPIATSPRERLVAGALAGEEPALQGLVDLLTPVIQARVARALLASRPPHDGRPVRPQVEDLTQEVFLLLFADGGRVLRSWRPEQGLSLENFVGLVARRRALSFLRSGRRSSWREDPTLDEPAAPEPAAAADLEKEAASREAMRLLLRRLQEELSPLGWHLFELLLVQERSVEEVERRTGMSRDALYAWRSRLRRLARQLLAEIAGGPVRTKLDAANLLGGC
jgi:RNA polymerase sigma-70 factor (ECF subfamily)